LCGSGDELAADGSLSLRLSEEEETDVGTTRSS
jgi:hypothetical protein